MIAVDATNVYWAVNATPRQIWKLPKTSTTPALLATLPAKTGVLETMVSDGVNLYWTDDAADAVLTTPVNALSACDDMAKTCGVLSQQSEGTHPTGIALDDEAIYWAFSSGPGATGPGTIWAIAK